MARVRPVEVLALLESQEQTMLDLYYAVKNAAPEMFGGKTLHHIRTLNARAAWLGVRVAVARHRAQRESQPDPIFKTDSPAPLADER